MTIRILSILLSLTILLSFTGCNKMIPQDIPNSSKDNQAYNKEDVQLPSTPDTASGTKLTKEDAAKIALSHAGLSSEEVSHLYTESDFDDGIHKYEVKFFHNAYEYDYEIDAQSGAILSFDKDRD